MLENNLYRPDPKVCRQEVCRNWARLIKKVYEIDPLRCPKYGGDMRIIAFIELPSVIENILKHLGLWFTLARAPPRKHIQSISEDELIQFEKPLQGFFPDPDYTWAEYS